MQSSSFVRAALALILFAPVALPCSIAQPRDVPFNFDHYAFYGEVIGYASTRMERCGEKDEGAKCPSSWGTRIRILEPIYVPGRDITEVEYFEFGIDSMCAQEPASEAGVREEYPIGTRVGLAASLYTEGEPGTRKIRLTTLDPPIFNAVAVLPKDSDLKKLAATPFDYVRFAGSERNSSWGFLQRLYFEVWRDKLRLRASRNEREALAILLRVAPTETLGEFASDDDYTAIEQLVDQYLPTPAVREEFARRLREQASSAAK